jgi:hypothetical protein
VSSVTPKGAPYPILGDPNDAPFYIFTLAEWVDARPGTQVMTTGERDALAGGDVWDGRLIYNSTTDRLESYDLATTTWRKVLLEADLTDALAGDIQDAIDAAVDGLTKVLGWVETSATKSTTSTSLVDVDAAMEITFTVPATGTVYVTLDGSASEQSGATTTGVWAIREGTTVIDQRDVYFFNALTRQQFHYAFRITGLTPGATHTWKWSFSIATGNHQIFSPAIMRIDG